MTTLPLKNPFGPPVYYEETLSSTFDAARLLAGQGEPHGTVIAADFQEAGRGRPKPGARLNDSWTAEKGKNLLFTILLRYGDLAGIPAALTLRTGLAVSLAIEDLAPALAGDVLVKWPNDVMIRERNAEAACNVKPSIKAEAAFKAAGILTETDGKNVFIGVGVNVGQTEFPEGYRSKAGSIIRAFPGLPENARFILLGKILSRLYEEIENPVNGFSWREPLLKRLYKRGETVSFAEGLAGSDRLIEGTLSGIGEAGELLIIPEGEEKERAYVTGELRVYGL